LARWNGISSTDGAKKRLSLLSRKKWVESGMSIITPTRVREIVALDEQPVLRNLLITDAYHRLTLSMAQLHPGGDLAWPVFATWASKQAGAFIRQEEIPRALLDTLELERIPVVRAILDGITRFIIGGNTIVFEELGLAFAGFVETFADPSARTEANLATLLANFSEGESMPDQVTVAPDGTLVRKGDGGQSLVRTALRHNFEALRETQVDARAELLLLANVECGLHEQIRLQPYIAGALDTPFEELLRLAKVPAHPLAERSADVARRISTELLMTMATPHEIIDLGSDLKAPMGASMWPAELSNLRNETLLALADHVGAYDARERDLELGDRVEGWVNAFMSKLGLARPEAQGTGAKRWGQLDDRMRFIFEYFRSRQRHAALLAPPFSSAQQVEIHAGRVPAGPL
jgi:hypothetical protein